MRLGALYVLDKILALSRQSTLFNRHCLLQKVKLWGYNRDKVFQKAR